MPLKLNSSGGGSVTLDTPSTASNLTFTLPSATSKAAYADSSDNLQVNSGYGSYATGYVARAWVNFNGTGTVAIRASGNVSSITDNGAGDYTVNFATAMPDANYAFTVGFNNENNAYPRVFGTYGETPTASALRLKTAYTLSFGTQTFEDYNRLCVAIFR